MAALTLALAGLSIVGKGISAYSSYKEGKRLNEAYREQGALLKAESYRDAKIIREQGYLFAEEQKMAYVGTGVQFAGSALITVAQTKSFAEAEAKAQQRRGDALEKRYIDSGKAALNQGRAGLISGLFGAAKSGFGAYQQIKK